MLALLLRIRFIYSIHWGHTDDGTFSRHDTRVLTAQSQWDNESLIIGSRECFKTEEG